ncbi:hypothetical protein [Clostridium lacusfryxellense]|uniref:hypothetical protein n=1 Tax=Clostridium lacusfryxellense TaxID=205328 RepID=UPI001C0E44D8|nr:hypothetical protein [Clostridium lacusfryxellense]MBU3111967.1 hypothetical protein [Clostridium lacusfryxellense]
MWIKSQDKTELIDANRIQLDRTSIYAITSDEQHSGVQLGVYKSNEVAAKVLESIQNRIIVLEKLKIVSYTREISIGVGAVFVYNMPQNEGEIDGVN